MGDLYKPEASEPYAWIVIFNPVSDSRLIRTICFGRFKHVAAVAYVPDIRVWVTYDVGFFGTRITMVPKGQEHQFNNWIEGCTLVVMMKKNFMRKSPPVFGWCVPAIKRLIGVKSSALRPDALYRHYLRDGGKIIDTNVFPGASRAAN